MSYPVQSEARWHEIDSLHDHRGGYSHLADDLDMVDEKNKTQTSLHPSRVNRLIAGSIILSTV